MVKSKCFPAPVVALALGCVLAAVSFAGANPAGPFLVGGGPALAGQFPAQVAVHIGATQFCGGSILNQNHVLTAASCVLDGANHLIAAGQVTVRAGVLMLDAATPPLAVQRIFPHQQYNPWTFENDIAVLRMAVNFNFPQVALPNMAPATLNHRIVRELALCHVVGWNWLPTAPNVPLQSLEVEYAPRDTCNTDHGGMLRESMSCTRYITPAAPQTGICPANRGGGLYCDGGLTGLVSFGFGCGVNASSTVYTQVRYYTHWLEQQFARTDTPPAGTTPMPGFGPGDDASSLSLSLGAALVAAVSALLLNY